MKLFFGEVFPEVNIDEEEQHHILKVLRMRAGAEIHVTDGKGNAVRGNLKPEGKKVSLDVLEISRNVPHYPIELHIAIAPTKNIDRLEFFVEKATEMGISEITFLHTEKTERKNLNLDKLRKQSISASKQSLRFHFPKINDLIKISDFVKNHDFKNTFVAHCDQTLDRKNLSDVELPQTLTFLIGPEGDFSPGEIQILLKKGARPVSLGPQRLRTETAGVFVAAWVYGKMCEYPL